VVESDGEKVQKLIEMDVPVIEGDATDDAILRAAGVERARGLIVALPTDKDNLFVVISARALNKSLRIVSKVNDLTAESKFLHSGATKVVSAHFIAGLRMASEMIRPDAVQFLDTMLRDNSALRVEDVTVRGSSAHAGKPLGSVDILKKTGVLVVSLKRDGAFQFNPPSTTLLRDNDHLILIGSPDQIGSVKSDFK